MYLIDLYTWLKATLSVAFMFIVDFLLNFGKYLHNVLLIFEDVNVPYAIYDGL